MERRHFLKTAAIAAPCLAYGVSHSKAQGSKEKPPRIPDEMVKQFVSAGHNNLPEVQRMLAEEPGLLYASWDLGGGDFESALDGAGHVGDREIAMYLIGQGARASIFVHAMLGRMDLVKRMIELDPSVLHSKGPHGFTLLHHAERGGEEAIELMEYVQMLGLKESKLSIP